MVLYQQSLKVWWRSFLHVCEQFWSVKNSLEKKLKLLFKLKVSCLAVFAYYYYYFLSIIIKQNLNMTIVFDISTFKRRIYSCSCKAHDVYGGIPDIMFQWKACGSWCMPRCSIKILHSPALAWLWSGRKFNRFVLVQRLILFLF